MPVSILKPGWLKIWHSAAFAGRFCGKVNAKSIYPLALFFQNDKSQNT
jgi:hypothetical protein